MKKLILLFFVAVVFVCSGTIVAQTLTSDQPDYAPGSTATLSGSGFSAGESVTMQVLRVDDPSDNGSEHNPWQVTADASGNFQTTWHVTPDEAGGSLKATADGGSSGLHAEALFTDTE